MKNLILALCSVLLVACQQNNSRTREINPSFESFVTQFEKLSQTHKNPVSANDLIMGFDDSLEHTATLGYCRLSGGTPTVNMNPYYWDRLSVSSKEQLVFHELGHCLLGRLHVNTLQIAADAASSLPKSMMYPYHLGSNLYEVNHAYYINELFGTTTYGAIYVFAPNTYDGSAYASTLASSVETTHYTKASKLVENEFGELEIEGLGCGAE